MDSDATGNIITIQGRLLDADGQPVPDAQLELWQANPEGKYAQPEDSQEKTIHPDFVGFGRIPTGENGEFRFVTTKPGAVPGPGGSLQAPHIVVLLFMRGLLRHLMTRIYFSDEGDNEADAVLQAVPAERRFTLIAKRNAANEQSYEWNIHLQGEKETVFFDA